jgi:L,D-transpeptidase YcbB
MEGRRTSMGTNSWGIAASAFGLVSVAIVVHLHLWAAISSAQSHVEPIRELLRTRLEEGRKQSVMRAANEPLCAMELLRRFYQQRTYQPAWSNGSEPLAHAYSFTQAIRGAYQEGLNPEDYHLAAIEKLLGPVSPKPLAVNSLTPVEFVDLDLLLADAFLSLSNDFSAGRVQPEGRLANWPCGNSYLDLAALLDSVVSSKNVESSLQALLPQRAGYRRLREVLAQYRDTAANGVGERCRMGQSWPREARENE